MGKDYRERNGVAISIFNGKDLSDNHQISRLWNRRLHRHLKRRGYYLRRCRGFVR